MKKTAEAIGNFGETNPIACPQCGKSVRMQVLRATNGVGLFGISLYNVNQDLFAICPQCDALFSVDRNVSKITAKEKGNQPVALMPDALTYQQTLPLKKDN